MKKYLIASAILIVCCAAIAVKTLTASSKKDIDLNIFLVQAGFKKVPSLEKFGVSAEKEYWLTKYGLYFISYKDMDTLCKANDFIIGESNRYKEEIPSASVKTMAENYNKIKDELISYAFRTNGQLTAPPDMYFSASEVGYWLRGESNMRMYECDFISQKLEKRLTKRGRKVMQEYGKTKCSDWELIRDYSLEKIYVVAQTDKFDLTGMHVENHLLVADRKPDPIAVIKHRKGYVVLAKW